MRPSTMPGTDERIVTVLPLGLEKFSTAKSGDLVAERHGADGVKPPFFICVKLTTSIRMFRKLREELEGWPFRSMFEESDDQSSVVSFSLLLDPGGAMKMLSPYSTEQGLDLMYTVVARADDMVKGCNQAPLSSAVRALGS